MQAVARMPSLYPSCAPASVGRAELEVFIDRSARGAAVQLHGLVGVS
jgi:hypothetical protein